LAVANVTADSKVGVKTVSDYFIKSLVCLSKLATKVSDRAVVLHKAVYRMMLYVAVCSYG